MKNAKSIKITKVKATKNKLEVELDISKKISKYFLKNHFEVFYDKNIDNVDESILTILPVLSTIQISWATGADLYVKKLDETCLLYLKKLRKAFETCHPNFSTSGNIYVEKIIPNKFNNNQSALFFSSGLDSLYSYVRNKDQNPILVTLLRVNDSKRLDEDNNDLKNLTQKFSEQEGMKIHFIRSMLWNFSRNEIINDHMLDHDFKVNWWEDVAADLVALGLMAPITAESIGRILYSSTYQKNLRATAFPGCHFLANNDFSWSDIDVVYYGNLSRQEKIHFLSKTPHYFKNLLVCFYPIQSLNLKNCGCCVKCWRTITGLILDGIDPNECNFHIKNNVLDEIKDMIIACPFLFRQWYFFSDIQKHIPDTIEDDEISRSYNSKQFFEWYKDYKFPDYKKGYRFFNYLKFFYYCEKYNGIDFTIKRALGHIQRTIQRMRF